MTWECPSCGFTSNEYVEDRCSCGYQIRTIHKGANNTEDTDHILIMLSGRPDKFWLSIFILLIMTIYFVFGAVIPVLTTGDYLSVWPTTSSKRIVRDICIFYSGLVWTFCIPLIFRWILSAGDYRFYNDRIVNRPILTGLERTFFYRDIIVNQHGLLRITFCQKEVPGWENPLRRLMFLFVNERGFSIRQPPYGYVEPEQLENIISLLKSRTDYRIRRPS